jgi:rhodanese-related sulfurtransferase
MGAKENKDALYDGLASVAKALGSGRRAELVDVLAQGERRVDDLAEEISQSVANTSHHLQTLLRCGLVRTRREGTSVFYALASEQVTDMWLVMRDVATAHAANVDRLADAYLGDRSDLDVISRDQLLDRLNAGDVVVLDVRPHAEFAAGHVPGAINIPVDDLADRLQQLPDGTQVVAYCRGPLCVLSVDAVRLLRNAGRPAALLEDGYPEWASAGLPVERTSA